MEQNRIIVFGAALREARAAAILVHGRGATAESLEPLAQALAAPGLAVLAPQAPGNTWYPYPLTAPVAQNEPQLSEALKTLTDLVAHIEQAGLPAEQILLGGFSQGASLSLEFVARNARRYGGVAGFSGGLIGAPGVPRQDHGNLEGTPIFLGCSDPDPYIPHDRVLLTEKTLRALGGVVTARFYPHMGHTINQDELDFVRGMIETLIE